jgi:hypothetical protein
MAPYISDSERRAASRMTWSDLVAHVCAAEQCDEREARRQIGNAINDGKLFARWADKPVIPPMPGSKIPFVPKDTTSALMPDDAPPRDATYWMECEGQATDPDYILEPPPYDPGMVNKRTAQRLDKRRRFRKPLFQRDSVLYLWRLVEAAPTAGESVPNDKKIVAFPKEPSKAPRGRPSERDTVRQTLAQMRAEGASLREPHKRLAEIVAKKNGRTLGDRRWDERTIVQHISEWLRENPDTV